MRLRFQPRKLSRYRNDKSMSKVTRTDSTDALPVPSADVRKLEAQGVRLCLQEKYSDAEAALREAFALSPSDTSVMNNLAVVLERAGQTANAIAMAERSLALVPNQPDSWVFLGNLREKTDNTPAAAAAYQRAVECDPSSAIAWQAMGIARQQQKRFTDAIDCLRQCIRLNHVNAAILAILGQCFYSTGQFELSRDAYAAAVEREPVNDVFRSMLREMKFICALIEGTAIDRALNDFLIDHAGFTLERDAEQLLHKTFVLLSSYEYSFAAQTVADKRAELFPTSVAAVYYAQAMEGTGPAKSPEDYIIKTFDAVAEKFDAHLTQTLGYDIPRQLCEALISQAPTDVRLQILDAGCGTGLCGPFLRTIAGTLVGVDLSPQMLKVARRQPYDKLVCSEITAYLNDSPTQFDLIAAADVLIYFGDLKLLAAAMYTALRPGGIVGFSIERCDDREYALQPSGRYRQSIEYVRQIFDEVFFLIEHVPTTIRQEANREVAGDIFLFRRK